MELSSVNWMRSDSQVGFGLAKVEANRFKVLNIRLDTNEYSDEVSERKMPFDGDMSIYFGAGDKGFSIKRMTGSLIYQIPLETFPHQFSTLRSLHGVIIRGASPMGRLLSSQLRGLSHQIQYLDFDSAEVAVSNMLNLVCACHLRIKNIASKRSNYDSVTLLKIKQYISQHIEDTSLTPVRIAKTFNLSVRCLYYLFASESISVAKYIREERLLAAKKQLISSVNGKRSISEIAYDVGFNNISHFCKLFKSRFGETPMDMKLRYRV